MKIFAERLEVSFAVGIGLILFLLTTASLLFRH